MNGCSAATIPRSTHRPCAFGGIHQNDFLIGEMIHDMVTELGYRVTHVAHRFGSALREISNENFDGALVNIGIDADM